jgi:hypothetical protein
MRFYYLCPVLTLLSACGQADYSTWNCYPKNDPTKKVVMVLQQSTMKMGEEKLRFCSSLGLVSYFDKDCKGATKQAYAQFILSESRLIIGDQQYQCEKL